MKHASKTAAKGFTLIELIVVISIIGILAAMAIPRFIALQKDARLAKVQGIYGSIRSAAMLARSECEVNMSGNRPATSTDNPALTGTCYVKASASDADGPGTIAMDGQTISMINKYPQALDTTAGILGAAQLDAATDGFDITGGSAGSGAGAVLSIKLIGADDPESCAITYTAAEAGKAPIIELDKTKC